MTMPAADDRRSADNLPKDNRLPLRSPNTADSRERAVVDVEREHAALRRLFHEVAAAIGAGGATDAAAELMVQLNAELRAHFQMEEVNGIFDQIERDAPQLVGAIQRLRIDHVELLVDAEHLADLGRGMQNNEGRRQFELLFLRFRDRVANHESEENCVVQSAYCVDVGTKD